MKRGLSLSLLLLAAGLSVDFIRSIDQPIALPQPQEIDIPRKSGLFAISQQLSQNHILTRPYWFAALGYANGQSRKLKYGTYEIKPGMTPRDILDMLAAGRIKQYPVVLVEGWNMTQIKAGLASHPELQQMIQDKTQQDIMKLIAPECQTAACRNPEGWFFPSTYLVTKGTADIDLLKRAYHKMQTELATAWEQRTTDLPYSTPYEALTLASIVEKETAVPDERPAIAGVFVRRLQKGMRLQTDPTVIYGLGTRYDGNIHSRDLLTDTPYNTYTRAGLPPTPIALAGAESLRAVLYPAPGNSLYFVAKGDGTHQFSETLEQHNAAVDTYQRQKHAPR